MPASDNMQKLSKITGLCIVLALFFGCRDQSIDPDTSRLGINFFPIEKGMFWEYEVKLTTYNLLDSLPAHFFLKEVVADSFTDLSGATTYKLERFVRDKEAEEWERDSVWTARVTTYQAVRIENNMAFVKLAFPLREGNTWNGNVLNTKEEENYEAKNLDASLQVGDSTFSNTVTIVQSEVLDTLVFQDVRREYYAREIGLIKKEYIQLNYCSSPECFGLKQIDSGKRLYMDLVANGKE